MKTFLKYSFTTLTYIVIYNLFLYFAFLDILNSKTLIFPYLNNNHSFFSSYPNAWDYICNYFIISNFITSLIIIINIQYLRYKSVKKVKNKNKNTFFKFNENNFEEKKISYSKFLSNKEKLMLLIGFNSKGIPKVIDENSAFQNIIITGGIGTGKTASAMYPLTSQIINFASKDLNKKIGLLILDVKGNYLNYVLKACKKAGREKDVIVINAENGAKYNPLDKPELKPQVLAERLKYILLLFSPNNSESFWIDKSEQLISEVIKFIRIYNDNYVDFLEIHKVINYKEFYYLKKDEIKTKMKKNEYSEKVIYDLNLFFHYYEKEFLLLDDRTQGIIKAEISRITSTFISDYDIKNIFCSKKEENTFAGFEDLIKEGKIVVLNMNISEYSVLSKIVAAYLKLDFQGEVLKKVNYKNDRIVAFISDEYQEYVTRNDAGFYAQSRESKCINIVATQSYTSLKEKTVNENNANVILQNLCNKIWFRTDDDYTIEKAQKIIGKEEKKKISKTISESGNESGYSLITNKFKIQQANLSESLNAYTEFDYKFDTKFFTQSLKNFESLSFLSKNGEIDEIEKVYMIPYFLKDKL